MKIAVGTYAGTGVSQQIATSLTATPGFVWIKGGSNVACFRMSSMSGDKTKDVTGVTATFTGGITSLDSGGQFTVGTDARVNANGTTYYYWALYGSDGAGDCDVFSYTGTGSAHSKTDPGFQPDLVIICDEAANASTWTSSAHAADSTQRFSAVPIAGEVTSLDATGFSLGTGNRVNQSAHVYHALAVKNVAGFFKAQGYTGTGVSHNETGYGFQPDVILTERASSTGTAVHRYKDETGSNSFPVDASAESTLYITAIVSDGMTVSTNNFVNNNTSLYKTFAFKIGSTASILLADAMTATAQCETAVLSGTVFANVLAEAMTATADMPAGTLSGSGGTDATFTAELMTATAASPAGAMSGPGVIAAEVMLTTADMPVAVLSASDFAAGAMTATAAMPVASFLQGSVITAEVMTASAQMHVAALLPIVYGGGGTGSGGGTGGSGGAISINAYATDGTTWALTSKITNLRFTNTTQGGHGECTMVVADDVDPSTDALPWPGSRLELSDQYGVFWLGRVEDPGGDFYVGGATLRILARGYSSHLGDQVYRTSKVFTAGMTVEAVAQAVRNDLCPSIGTTNSYIGPTGRTLVSDTRDYLGQTAQDVLNDMMTMGNGAGIQLNWHVWTDGTSIPVLEVALRTTPAAYTVALSATASAPLTWPFQRVKNRVTLKWLNGVVTQENTTSQGGHPTGVGFIRDHFVDASTQVGSHAHAISITGTLLAHLGELKPVGENITVTYPFTVTDPAGFAIPLWRVRPGKVINVSGLATGAGLLAITPLFMTSTTYDDEARSLTIGIEDQDTLSDLLGTALAALNNNPASNPNPPTGTGISNPLRPLFADPVTDRLSTDDYPPGFEVVTIWFVINGGDTEITTGYKGDLPIEAPLHVDSARLMTRAVSGASSHSITVAVETGTYSGFPGSVGGTLVSLSGGDTAEADIDLDLAKDDVLAFNVTSCVDCAVASIAIKARKIVDLDEINIDDGVPPIISGVVATAGSTAVVVTWNTDEGTTGLVSYGLDASLGNDSSYYATLTVTHSIVITGLNPATTYHYIVTSSDNGGNTSSSADATFTTAP